MLAGMDMERKDLRYEYRIRGRLWVIEAFNPLWWLVSAAIFAGIAIATYWALVLVLVIG